MRNLLLIACFFVFGASQLQAQCSLILDPDTIQIDCGDTLTITAVGAGVAQMDNDFNLGNAGSGWSVSAAGQFNNPCGPGPDGIYMWAGDATPAPRNLQTNALDLSCGGIICFDYKMAIQGQASPCEGPDLANEGTSLQWSLNSGGPWTDIFYFQPNTNGSLNSESPGSGDYTGWANYCFPIPAGAITPATYIRWYQDGSSGNGFDHWGVDNVQIFNNCGYFFDWGNGLTSDDDSVVTPGVDTTYIVYLTNTIDDTCQASVVVDIIEPTINSTATPAIICQGDASQLDMTTVGIPANAGPGDFNWTPSTGLSNPTISNPTASPNTTTDYIVEYINQGAPQCSAVDTVTVTVVPNFTHSFTADNQNPCLSEPIGVQINTNPNQNYTYDWQIIPPGNATLDDNTIANPTITTNGFGTMSWTVTITSPDGCVHVDTFTIDVAQGFPPNITLVADSAVCPGDSILITATEDNNNPNMVYTWSPVPPVSTTNGSQVWVTPNGMTSVYVTAVDTANGCDVSDTIVVDNYPNPSFSISGTPDIGFAPLNVQLNQTDTTLVNMVWTTGDSGVYNTINPNHTFTTPGTYTVALTADNIYGCSGVAFTTIIVNEDLESVLSIPNVFSPNSDGYNDAFLVYSENLEDFHCEIYNRWGKKVYEWDNAGQGWDGGDNTEGTYYYVVTAVGVDGKTYEHAGTITLTR